MWMSVLLCHASVGRPTRVPHSSCSLHLSEIELLVKIRDFANTFLNDEVVVEGGDPCTVVPAIFHSSQCLEKYRGRVSLANVANDTAQGERERLFRKTISL